MIQKQTNFTIIADDTNASAMFTLKQENIAHVFNILRNNLYSDKILAVVREYSTNAIDANKENGKGHIPIEITIPTVIDPNFHIRDFGKGLSEEEIFEVYSSYGASTKRDSNDYVGTLGMGSKSAFGYADSFTITSFQNGMKKIYHAFIDESKIGTISKVHEEMSDEPSGIKVTVGVNSQDVKAFFDKCVQFFMWFDPMPKFYGQNIHLEIQNRKTSNYTILHSSENCTIYKDKYGYGQPKVFVKMGNICYPLTDKDSVDLKWLPYSHCLIINVEIGDVSFTTSRESLELTANTIDLLNSKIESIRIEVSKSYQSKINEQKSHWDAICFYYTLPEMPKNLLEKHLFYKNDKIDTNFLQLLQWTSYNGRQWREAYGINFASNQKVALIVNDGGFPVSHTSDRLKLARKMLLDENIYTRILYGKGSVNDTKKFLEYKELDGVKLIKLSEVAATTKNRKANFSDKDVVFKWNMMSVYPHSACWDSVTEKLDREIVCVEIDKFVPKNMNFKELNNIHSALISLGENIEIYGVKKGANINKKWVSLNSYIERLVSKYLQDKNFVRRYKNNHFDITFSKDNFTKSIILGKYVDYNATKNKDFKKLFELQNLSEKLTSMDSIIVKFMNQVRLNNLSLDKKITALENEVEEEVQVFRDALKNIYANFPLIDYSYSSWNNYKVEPKNIMDYVHCIKHTI